MPTTTTTKKSTKTTAIVPAAQAVKAKKVVLVPKLGIHGSQLVIPVDVAREVQGTSGEYIDFKVLGEGDTQVCVVDMNDLPINMLRAVGVHESSPVDVKATIKKMLARTPEELLGQVVEDPQELYRVLRFVSHVKLPIIEFQLNGIWYPIPLEVRFWKGWFTTECALIVNLQIQDKKFYHQWFISDSNFREEGGTGPSIKKTVGTLLMELGFRFTTKERVAAFKNKLIRASAISGKNGMVLDTTSSVLMEVNVGWSTKLLPYALGTPTNPKRVIVEEELEAEQGRGHNNSEDKVYALPFLRVFSPKMKKYCYVDVETTTEHVYATDARKLLVLPTFMARALDAVFDTPTEEVFGDLFDGRHGGVVILAAGDTGTGKTLTAEVYAESTKRPLYVMEMGELGVELATVEENLQKIFDRARRWNAILLFDEADIFLSKRQEAELEKSAIVGTFLRLLDHYEGTFFLTTNREDIIDDAIRSRITMRLSYPNLTDDSRAQIWDQLLGKAGLVFTGSRPDLLAENLNGRNIRNLVRVLRLLNPGAKNVNMEQVRAGLTFISRPQTTN
jgi:hypothetical protein